MYITSLEFSDYKLRMLAITHCHRIWPNFTDERANYVQHVGLASAMCEMMNVHKHKIPQSLGC